MEEPGEIERKSTVRTGSNSRRAMSNRSGLSDCTEKVEKCSVDYKELGKKLLALNVKIAKYKETTEKLQENITTTENEIGKIKNNIQILQNQSINVKNANHKLISDTKSVIGQIITQKKKVSRNSPLKSTEKIQKLKEKIGSEMIIIEKVNHISKKMRKQILLEKKAKEESKDENLKYLKKIKCLRQKIDDFNMSASDILYKLS